MGQVRGGSAERGFFRWGSWARWCAAVSPLARAGGIHRRTGGVGQGSPCWWSNVRCSSRPGMVTTRRIRLHRDQPDRRHGNRRPRSRRSRRSRSSCRRPAAGMSRRPELNTGSQWAGRSGRHRCIPSGRTSRRQAVGRGFSRAFHRKGQVGVGVVARTRARTERMDHLQPRVPVGSRTSQRRGVCGDLGSDAAVGRWLCDNTRSARLPRGATCDLSSSGNTGRPRPSATSRSTIGALGHRGWVNTGHHSALAGFPGGHSANCEQGRVANGEGEPNAEISRGLAIL
jgi:hypothetical protein